MRDDTLIVEDALMLMMDDASGTPANAGTLPYALGGAVLVELALLGRVEADESRAGLGGPMVVAVGDGPLPDPVLQSAYDVVARRPRRVQALLTELGDLWKVLTDRLVERGLVRREKRKLLGLIPTTRLPSTASRHETELRQRVVDVLENGAEPDAHTAAVIGLISASGTLPSLHPRPRWSTAVIERAKALEEGNWGAGAVSNAVLNTAVAIAAASAAVVATSATAR
ncbi:GPP34 family phosphoprotein [Pseudonocardia nematodicida]|uniref:GPP34 family phosphoprotein n=1 Tax=Pseudonocardia nematodicida TaxID=1206997 RepID=A0ABV1KGK1_9PSEU